MFEYPTMLIVYVFVVGLCVGSFMNVCIYRLPASGSIIRPPSRCPRCGNPIRFYHNIPLLGYLWLRGRCRDCKSPISIRYPLVECISGLFALCVLFKFGPTHQGLIYYAFISTLTIITFIDIDHRIIPDVISLPGIPICLLSTLILPEIFFKDAVIGLLAGGGSLLLTAWTYHLLTHNEGMGGGDIKLLAMIGAMIGWKGVLFTIFIASALGTLVGLLIILLSGKNMKYAVPFGPFLSIAATLYLFVGPWLIDWYFNRFYFM